MAKWLAKEFDWDTGRYTGRYYDIAEAGIVAKFVDSFYGDDSTGDGSSSTPYKTLGAAITDLNSTGANGSRIFMNGIFSENLPARTYAYHYIGCGGGKNGRTVWYAGVSVAIAFTTGGFPNDGYFENIELMNYSGIIFYRTGAEGRTAYWLNSWFKKASVQVRGGKIYYYYCIISELETFYAAGYDFLSPYCYKCIIVDNNCNGTVTGTDNYLRNNTWTGGGANSITDVDAQFINEGIGDFNVRITSPLIGTGSVDEITGNPTNVGGVDLGIPYNGLTSEFSETGGAIVTDLTIDSTGKYTITHPTTTGALATALMELGNIYPLENIDLFNAYVFLSG